MFFVPIDTTFSRGNDSLVVGGKQMGANHTDKEITLLVTKAQKRDQQAFELLYERCHTHVSSRVYTIIGRVESMQDVTQEIWLAVFLALPTLKNPAAFPGWLMRIASHKAWKFAKQHALQTISLDAQDEEALFLALVGDEDPVETVLRAEYRSLLEHMFALLSDKEREVFILFYLEEISLAEIATRLELSLSTIKSRLYQARKRLRPILLKGECFP